jgi:hypothetical protein
VAVAVVTRHAGRRATTTVARGAFLTAAARTATSRLRLTHAGRALLTANRSHRRRVRVTVTAHDLAGAHATLHTTLTLVGRGDWSAGARRAARVSRQHTC